MFSACFIKVEPLFQENTSGKQKVGSLHLWFWFILTHNVICGRIYRQTG